jgi:hypothetical protein
MGDVAGSCPSRVEVVDPVGLAGVDGQAFDRAVRAVHVGRTGYFGLIVLAGEAAGASALVGKRVVVADTVVLAGVQVTGKDVGAGETDEAQSTAAGGEGDIYEVNEVLVAVAVVGAEGGVGLLGELD